MRRRGVLPGFRLTLGYVILYLSLLVLLPLSAVVVRSSSLGFGQFLSVVTEPRTLSAFGLSLGASLVAAVINTVFGVIVAWVLVRYSFPGKSLVDSLVDLPFALPTAVAGIALTSLYAENGLLGKVLTGYDIKVAFTRVGVVVALVFIGIPFVVRTVQPVLEELDVSLEEAAAVLGASRWQTLVRVLFPALLPSALTGFALAFARALGEYGSVVFISGNMPGLTEIAPLLVVTKLEQYDYGGATAIATVLLALSFVMLFAINLLQRWSQRVTA